MSSSMTGFGGMQSKGMSQGNKIPSGYKQGQLQQFTPEQMQLFSQLFGSVGPQSYLGRLAGGDEEAFQNIEGPAMRKFSELQGNIASRFSGMGTGGRKSSGFQNTMSAASSNFAQDLAAKRQDIQRQALLDMMGMSNTLLGQRPYEQFLTKKEHKPSFLESLMSGLFSLGGAGAGGYFGGLPGAQLGGQLGGQFGQGFMQ